MNLSESIWFKMNLGESSAMSRSLYPDFADERYYANDGSGGICCNCNRYFKSQFALEAHQASYCRNLLKGKEESGVAYEEPTEDEPWLDGLINEDTALHYARLCIKYLNQKSDGQYKLVKCGNYQATAIARGSVVHFNFKAKPDNGPVETFFAQLWSPSALLHHQPDYAEFVVSLGHDVPLPNWGSAPVGDCIYCDFPVHHPSPGTEGCEKLIMGDKISTHAPFLPPEHLERLRKFFADEMAKCAASSSHHRFQCV